MGNYDPLHWIQGKSFSDEKYDVPPESHWTVEEKEPCSSVTGCCMVFRAPIANQSEALEYDTEFLPLSTRLGEHTHLKTGPNSYQVNWPALKKAERHEHIAGPHCESRRGYHGHHISVEEMRGCNTVQCIIRKKSDWKPRSDDLDFERTSQCHLTGVAGRMPISGWYLQFAPIRHGAEGIEVESVMAAGCVQLRVSLQEPLLLYRNELGMGHSTHRFSRLKRTSKI
jgi:hypothetical protein